MAMLTKLLFLFASLAVRQAASQTNCGGTKYTPGSVNFTQECYQTVQDCIKQFGANVSQVYCQGAAGNIYMEQQPSGGSNSKYEVGFNDILNLCLLDGWYTGTWYSSQWYWIAAKSGCYSPSGTIATTGPGYCVQNSDDTVIGGCYPQPAANSGPLQVLKTSPGAGGFKSSGRGWNSWGIEALKDPESVVPGWTGFNQESVLKQCSILATPAFKAAGYNLCSLDAGWSTQETDENGRITYNTTLFNLPQLADKLHGKGLKLGVYVIPGVPCTASDRTIEGTNILVGDVFNGNKDGLNYCDFDFSKNGVQQWHNSLVNLWASWGVDMIKLDFVTPGSPQNGADLICNHSDAVEAYRNAIDQSGRKIRLDISWKLCRNETYLPIWSSLANSMRTDQDIDNYGTNTFTAWWIVQRAIDNYRQFISLEKQYNIPIRIYPDMDNLFVGNAETMTGLTDAERTTTMNHWLGAAANLVLGSDLENMDELGMKLVTSPQSVALADFAAQYPMQPRNPGTGNNLAKQLQAWIAGPSHQNEAYVLIVNYGPDGGSGGFHTSMTGIQEVTVSLSDLGIAGSSWHFTDIWNGNSTIVSKSYTAYLNESESQMLHLQQVSKGDGH